MEDKHLLEAWNRYIATSDMVTLAEVYDVLYKDTLFFAKSRCKDYPHLEAEEIVSAVWEKLVVKKPHIDSNIRSYILAMTKNAVIDLLRKNNRIISDEIAENTLSESIKLMFLKEEERKQRDLEIKKCLNDREYNFIMLLDDLLINESKKVAHKKLSEILGIALQTVNNTRTLITKKLNACRANRSK